MGDFSARLRQTATRSGLLEGRSLTEQQRSAVQAFLRSLGPLLADLASVRGEVTPDSLREPVYLLATVCALSGIEVEPMLEADLARRELMAAKPGPREAAPIPDAGGVWRDPVTKLPV